MSDSLVARLSPTDFEQVAQLVLPAPIYGWIASGSEDAQSLLDNVAAFRRWRLSARTLVDVRAVDISTSVCGTAIDFPVMVAPMGLHRAIHADGELGTAAGVVSTGSLFVQAVNATTTMEDVKAAQPNLKWWLQLYNWLERDAIERIVRRAEAAGASGIVPLVNTTADVAHTPARVGYRPPAGVSLVYSESTGSAGLEYGLTEEYIEWLARLTTLPIIPKGIVRGDDALRAVNAGARGIMVSNHGGRQLSHEVSTLDALPGVVAAVGKKADVILDGGVRHPSDALIALALGAKAVTLGRPVAYALAVGGGEGVSRMLGWFKEGVRAEAMLTGIQKLDAFPSDLLVRHGGA
jgi:isopentenyl diphosphate isomerase/L-lactate dehydrogenase-like FMN-dependent dehydrogenase